MHNRAHPRHYRSEYVRGYLHRQADVYSLPGWSQLVIPYIYRVNDNTDNLSQYNNANEGVSKVQTARPEGEVEVGSPDKSGDR